jgi:hypothetical protein
MAPEVKTAKNSKLPNLSENCFELVGKGGWPLISIWIIENLPLQYPMSMTTRFFNPNPKITRYRYMYG